MDALGCAIPLIAGGAKIIEWYFGDMYFMAEKGSGGVGVTEESCKVVPHDSFYTDGTIRIETTPKTNWSGGASYALTKQDSIKTADILVAQMESDAGFESTMVFLYPFTKKYRSQASQFQLFKGLPESWYTEWGLSSFNSNLGTFYFMLENDGTLTIRPGDLDYNANKSLKPNYSPSAGFHLGLFFITL